MSQTAAKRSRPAESPAPIQPESPAVRSKAIVEGKPVPVKPKGNPPQPERASVFARKIRERLDGQLESEFGDFVEQSTLEEKRFMIEVLIERNQYGSLGRPNEPSEFCVPLYSAIEYQLSGRPCVAVPNLEMIHSVNEFIASLSSRKLKNVSSGDVNSEQAIRNRWERSTRRDFELFARDAGTPSLRLMSDILARWNELAHDPEISTRPNVLAAAAEITLDAYQAKTAAEKVAA